MQSPRSVNAKSAMQDIKSAIMTSGQLRAARALLDWSQTTLAEKSGLSVETVKRLERIKGSLEATKVSTLEAITKAFDKAGVEFTNGDAPGVRMKAKR
jgi:transcriptional regulator with XRE-family HTH domain